MILPGIIPCIEYPLLLKSNISLGLNTYQQQNLTVNKVANITCNLILAMSLILNAGWEESRINQWG